jgi:uncharacterized protein
MLELRHVKAELRASKTGKPQIFGYAATFNVNAQLPGFRECIRAGAFTRAIRDNQDVVALFNHDANLVLGRTTSGTLRLKQDAKGLYYTCDLPDTEAGRNAHTSIQRGDINGCSFAFKMVEGGQKWSEGRAADGSFFVQREITDCDLLDVSPVTYPCYSGTAVDARAVAQVPPELRSAVDTKNADRIVAPTLVPTLDEPDIEEKFRRLGLLRLAYMD